MQVIRTTRPNTALLPQMFANSPALQGRYSGGTKAFFSNSPAQMPADPTALGAGSGPDIQRRMSAAFDRLQAEELVKETATQVDSKTVRTLGRLVLEFEQVNDNLRGMQKGIKEDIREQKKLFRRKKRLKDKEEKELKSLKGMFFDFRSSIAGFSALVATKELLEGDFQGALQPAVAAVTLMLPEIINITSSVILGGLGIKALAGGKGRGAAPAGAGRAPRVRGGGRAGLALALGAGALGFAGGALLPRNDSDARIAAARQQKVISAEDVDRFGVSIAKFDEVVQSMLPKSARNKDKNGGMSDGEFEKKKPDTGSPATPAKGGGAAATPTTPAVPGAPTAGVSYDGNLSGDAITQTKQLLRDSEGFRTEPYWDVNAWRIGYGSDTITDANGNVRRVTTADRVTREEAEFDLERRIKTEFMPSAANAIGDSWSNLPPSAQAALTSITYNYGSLPSNVVRAAQGGNLNAIADAVTALQHHNGGINRSRRLEEASIIRNAQRSEKLQSSIQPNVNAISIPGQTQVMPTPVASKSNETNVVQVSTDYPSNDRFASNLLLGAYSA